MPSKAKKIIIVEDEPSLVFTLEDTLNSEGYEVFTTDEGQEAINLVDQKKPNLMILDLMLPGMSGFEICQEIRDKDFMLPIIILTARDQEVDKIKGLNMGADDYMTKPFSVKELLARIQALLRRSNQYDQGKQLKEIQLDDVAIDLQNAKAKHPDDSTVDLTTREVELIRYLSSRKNEPVSRDELLENVWRYEFSTNTRTVDVHISKLRSKIEKHPDNPNHLVTLHGVGYMLKMN